MCATCPCRRGECEAASCHDPCHCGASAEETRRGHGESGPEGIRPYGERTEGAMRHDHDLSAQQGSQRGYGRHPSAGCCCRAPAHSRLRRPACVGRDARCFWVYEIISVGSKRSSQ